jgi:hypothetical protein
MLLMLVNWPTSVNNNEKKDLAFMTFEDFSIHKFNARKDPYLLYILFDEKLLGILVDERKHVASNIWRTNYHKWFLSNGIYFYHFEKSDFSISALEMKKEYLINKKVDHSLRVCSNKNNAVGLHEIKINAKEQVAISDSPGRREEFNNPYYHWLININNIGVLETNYFITHVRFWDYKPHRACNTNLSLAQKLEAIGFTPNAILEKVILRQLKASTELDSEISCFKPHRIKKSLTEIRRVYQIP